MTCIYCCLIGTRTYSYLHYKVLLVFFGGSIKKFKQQRRQVVDQHTSKGEHWGYSHRIMNIIFNCLGTYTITIIIWTFFKSSHLKTDERNYFQNIYITQYKRKQQWLWSTKHSPIPCIGIFSDQIRRSSKLYICIA